MNANKIPIVISGGLRRALSSVAMGTAEQSLDQRLTRTVLALLPSPSLAPFRFKPRVPPRNVGYPTTNTCRRFNDKMICYIQKPTTNSSGLGVEPPRWASSSSLWVQGEGPGCSEITTPTRPSTSTISSSSIGSTTFSLQRLEKLYHCLPIKCL